MRDKISDADLYLWGEGTNSYAYLTLGCHKAEHRGYEVYRFAVWAPNAVSVRVVGSFNGWNMDADPMHPIGETALFAQYRVQPRAERPADRCCGQFEGCPP